jgi:hypothetical protein
MSFQFRPAVRESVGLLIGLAGGTGSGKTFTSFRLASGICKAIAEITGKPLQPFAVIDTESRRALHYADQFKFDHAELRPPFTPDAYAEAILAADKAGYPVIVVDSTSHVWAGDGGVLEMQEAELKRLGGSESVKMLSWAKPKGSHKKMVSKLLQVRAHLILNFRAEAKIEMVKDANGKMQIVAKQSLTGLDGWIPICEKTLPFELTVSFLMLAQHPGVGLPIKLQEQHKPLFPPGKLIDEECGRRIAQWAAGGEAPRAPAPVLTSEPEAETESGLIAQLEAEAEKGWPALQAAWQKLTQEQRDEVGPQFGALKKSAAQVSK